MNPTKPVSLPSDFADFLRLLNQHNVNYLIVGSWAVALHAVPRYTKDIDILVQKSPENSERIMTALIEFGFGNVGISAEDFRKDGYVVQLGYEPNRIDLLTDIDAVDFEIALGRKALFNIDAIQVPVISANDLIAAKRSAGRPQDLADLDKLTKIKKEKGQ